MEGEIILLSRPSTFVCIPNLACRSTSLEYISFLCIIFGYIHPSIHLQRYNRHLKNRSSVMSENQRLLDQISQVAGESPFYHATSRERDSNGLPSPLYPYSSTSAPAPAPLPLPSRTKNLSSHLFLSGIGQINRAKNQAAGIAPTPPPYVPSRRTFDRKALLSFSNERLNMT